MTKYDIGLTLPCDNHDVKSCFVTLVLALVGVLRIFTNIEFLESRNFLSSSSGGAPFSEPIAVSTS